jgi:hypothetical protein
MANVKRAIGTTQDIDDPHVDDDDRLDGKFHPSTRPDF